MASAALSRLRRRSFTQCFIVTSHQGRLPVQATHAAAAYSVGMLVNTCACARGVCRVFVVGWPPRVRRRSFTQWFIVTFGHRSFTQCFIVTFCHRSFTQCFIVTFVQIRHSQCLSRPPPRLPRATVLPHNHNRHQRPAIFNRSNHIRGLGFLF